MCMSKPSTPAPAVPLSSETSTAPVVNEVDETKKKRGQARASLTIPANSSGSSGLNIPT